MTIQLAGTYRAMKVPPKAGQVRTKSWRILIATEEDDPTWAKRAQEYWERQERVYGLKMSNFTLMVDHELMAITTVSIVAEVLPGAREPFYGLTMQ